MKLKPDVSILTSFLFILDIDYPHDDAVVEFICSSNINDKEELLGVFYRVVKPEYECCTEDEKKWLIDTLRFYLKRGEAFESVFDRRNLLFSEKVVDGRKFMETLLESLIGCR
ncbi:hypothetical protein SAMN04487857_102527 [Pseudomonas sp. ok272]|uniref:hypothetical protein n=1 Tax=unclassified Pseudomonas TaxID=196821 RepID=UPI0008AE85B4|nr:MULTISPECIES: hypothetical protein [unclassified Pseudomonas]SEM54250.1 hypothetical protein SAMN04487857_102527 [Pseudomonas sp. ok272]SFM26041.1 hypothetical protein SAMN04487858_101529 [Pseudomonas sp. ok602]